jgi:hypothetical protein
MGGVAFAEATPSRVERLARHDWRPTLITTDDFVVHIAVHDED